MRRLFDHGERTLSRALIARRIRFFFSLQVPSVDSLSVFRSSSEDFLFGGASHHERSSRRDLSKNVRPCRRLFENFQGFKQRSARRHYFLRHICYSKSKERNVLSYPAGRRIVSIWRRVWIEVAGKESAKESEGKLRGRRQGRR